MNTDQNGGQAQDVGDPGEGEGRLAPAVAFGVLTSYQLAYSKISLPALSRSIAFRTPRLGRRRKAASAYTGGAGSSAYRGT